VRSFKSAATKRINELRHSPGEPVWQRNYYDRVIRSDDAAHVPQHRIHQAPAFDDGPAHDEPEPGGEMIFAGLIIDPSVSGRHISSGPNRDHK